VEPRRNPEIVVCTLLEEGEHGYLAARTAAKVIKAFVEKQQRLPSKMAGKPKVAGKVEVGAVWTVPDEDAGRDSEKMLAGRFLVDVGKRPLAVVTSAPGMAPAH
jgi:hypothetical protein